MLRSAVTVSVLFVYSAMALVAVERRAPASSSMEVPAIVHRSSGASNSVKQSSGDRVRLVPV